MNCIVKWLTLRYGKVRYLTLALGLKMRPLWRAYATLLTSSFRMPSSRSCLGSTWGNTMRGEICELIEAYIVNSENKYCSTQQPYKPPSIVTLMMPTSVVFIIKIPSVKMEIAWVSLATCKKMKLWATYCIFQMQSLVLEFHPITT